MTTLTKNYQETLNHKSASGSIATRYNLFIKKIEFSYYGLIAMFILIASCYGAIVTMQIFENNAPLWQFIVSVSFTMANLVACIGQAPTKWVVGAFTASVAANTLLLLMNI